jgi:hypothetical protein
MTENNDDGIAALKVKQREFECLQTLLNSEDVKDYDVRQKVVATALSILKAVTESFDENDKDQKQQAFVWDALIDGANLVNRLSIEKLLNEDGVYAGKFLPGLQTVLKQVEVAYDVIKLTKIVKEKRNLISMITHQLTEMRTQKKAYIVMQVQFPPVATINYAGIQFVRGQRYEVIWANENNICVFDEDEGQFVEMSLSVFDDFFKLVEDFPLPPFKERKKPCLIS